MSDRFGLENQTWIERLKAHEDIAFAALDDYIQMLKSTGDKINEHELNRLFDKCDQAMQSVNDALGIEPIPDGVYPVMPATPLPEFFEMVDKS